LNFVPLRGGTPMEFYPPPGRHPKGILPPSGAYGESQLNVVLQWPGPYQVTWHIPGQLCSSFSASNAHPSALYLAWLIPEMPPARACSLPSAPQSCTTKTNYEDVNEQGLAFLSPKSRAANKAAQLTRGQGPEKSSVPMVTRHWDTGAQRPATLRGGPRWRPQEG